MQSPDYLTLGEVRRIAYHRTAASGEGARRPGVVFLGGYASDMTGTKATWLQDRCAARGRAFLRFDYTGHGRSSGAFEAGCIGDWADDALAALDRLTEGRQVLVGSSMGGWIALRLALARPGRLAGLVGVAAAPDFTEDLMWPGLDAASQARLMAEGRLEIPNPYDERPGVMTRRLIEDGRARLVLRSPLPLPCPLRLLHGDADADVPLSVALRLLAHAECADARLTIVKHGDHRMSDDAALRLLDETVDAIA